MKVFTCFLMFGILAYAKSQETDQRRLNLRADASKLSIEDYSLETKKPDNANNALISIDTTDTSTRVETLTDFIEEAVNILNTFEDTAFEDFFHILDSAIRKYHYGDCKFSEITQNHDTRKFLATVLKNIRKNPADITKTNINKMVDRMKAKTYSNDLKELLDYINSLYKNAEPRFLRVLQKLEQYTHTKSMKTHYDLAKFIRNAVRDLLFNHYTELDINIRSELKEKIETFWKRFKNNPVKSSQDYIIASDSIETVKVSENVMNEVKDAVNTKNNLKNVLRNKRHRSVSTETYEQQSEDEDVVEDENSNESDEQNIKTTDDISSGQSFDSSSNSIKQSQERHVDYNTARYVTLYTEEISYKARNTDKTDVKPISSHEVTERFTVLSTSTSKYSSEDQSNSNTVEVLRTNKDFNDTEQDIPVKLRTGQDDNQEKKHFKSDESKSKNKHTNTHNIGEYNAVIDVQLANTELLNGLGIFEPVTDKNSRYDSTTSQRFVKQTEKVHKKPTIHHRALQAIAETRKNNKRSKPKAMQTPRTKPPLRHSKSIYFKPLKVSNKTLRLSPEDVNFIRHTIEDEKHKQHLTRRNAYGGVDKNFNAHIIKRIDTLEKDLKGFRRTLLDDNSEEVNPNNVTNKVIGNDFVAKLMEKYQNLYKKDVNNTETAANDTITKQNATNIDAVNTTLVNDKNTSQVTNNTKNNAKIFNKDRNGDSETTVTGSTVKVTDATELKTLITPSKYIIKLST